MNIRHSLVNGNYIHLCWTKKSLHEIRPQGTFSLLFGNEATGLPDRFAQIGTSVIIPHSNRIDSLNLPIAASIAMYETTKQQFES